MWTQITPKIVCDDCVDDLIQKARNRDQIGGITSPKIIDIDGEDWIASPQAMSGLQSDGSIYSI